MPVTEQDVLNSLSTVKDPDVFKDLVAMGSIKSIKLFDTTVSVEISTASPQKDRIRSEAEAALRKLPGIDEVFVSFATSLGTAKGATPQKPAHAPPAKKPLANVKHIIAVGAGKGGVGKSMVAVNLAVGLALSGKRVGLLDGDIYGPSIPTMVGISPRPPEVVGEKIIPFSVKSPDGKTALGVMSIGFMVDKEKALIWRGPMAHGAMKQFLEQVDWAGGDSAAEGLDYLIVDLPPGTGDVALTLAQTVPLTGAVIVATPQEVALSDARRAVRMFQQLGVEILGVVENMSYFLCEHGSSYDIFGRGGAQVMAQQMGLPFLGEIPIETSLRENSDAGTPFQNFAPGKAADALRAVVDLLDKQVAVRLATRPAAKPIDLRIS